MFAAEFDYEQHVMYIFYATSGLVIASLLYIYWLFAYFLLNSSHNYAKFLHVNFQVRYF